MPTSNGFSGHYGASSSDPPLPTLLIRAIRTVLGQAGLALISFVFAILLARTLTPNERGLFALLQATNATVIILVNFAVATAATYHVSKKLLPPGRVVGAVIALGSLSGLLGLASLGPILWLFGDKLFSGIPPSLILLALALVIPLAIRTYLGGVLVSLHQPLRLVLGTAIQPLGAVVFLAVALAGGASGIGTSAIAWGVGIVSSALATFALTRPTVGPMSLRWDDVVMLGKFGIKTYPALLSRFLNLRLDQFLLRWLSSASQLGQYAVAVNIGELLIRIPNQMLLAFSGSISANDRTASAQLVAQFSRWTVLIIGLPALGIAAATPFAVPLAFGPEYRPAVTSVLLILPGLVLYAPGTVIMEYFLIQRHLPAKAAGIAATSLLVSTVLNVPLAPRFGAAGSAIASSISYGVMLFASLVAFRRDTGLSMGDMVIPKRKDISALFKGITQGLRVDQSLPKASGPDGEFPPSSEI